MTVEEFDAVVVGGGHNGLVAANYLARGGLRTLVTEQRGNLGGACSTEELFPGYSVSSCSYQLFMFQESIFDELALFDHGLEILPVDPILHLFPDGTMLRAWRDRDRTVEEVRAVSPADVAAFLRWSEFWDQVGDIFGRFMLAEDPPALAGLDGLLGATERDVVGRLRSQTIREMLDSYFGHEKVKTFALMSLGPVVGLDELGGPMSAAQEAMGRLGSSRYKGLPVRGMGSVSEAIAASARAVGVTIETSTRVSRILVENGRAAGVVLDDGRIIRSRAVVSNAGPDVTFERLLNRRDYANAKLAQSLRKTANTFHSMKFHASVSELPDLTSWLGPGADFSQLTNFRICPSVDYFEAVLNQVEAGKLVENPVVHVQIPTVIDPSAAPAGKHLVSMWIRSSPRKPPGESWEEVREAEAQRLVDLLTEYAPNFRSSLLDYVLFTPDDLEQRIGMIGGNINHIDHRGDQLLGDRLFPGGGHRTPLPGLYMCGAGTHPGGSVSGAPGFNAARKVLDDM